MKNEIIDDGVTHVFSPWYTSEAPAVRWTQTYLARAQAKANLEGKRMIYVRPPAMFESGGRFRYECEVAVL